MSKDDGKSSGRRGVGWWRVPVAIRPARAWFIVGLAVLLLVSAGHFAEAATLRQGVSAFNRQNYVLASQIFIPFAERGDPAAQTYLGIMFETGRGVPQNYTEAAMWYRRAAEQGDSLAQYSLGLLYDRGQGVPQDVVEASKWLNLSAAAAPPAGPGSPRPYSRCRDQQDDARRDRAGPVAGAGMGAEPRALSFRYTVFRYLQGCQEPGVGWQLSLHGVVFDIFVDTLRQVPGRVSSAAPRPASRARLPAPGTTQREGRRSPSAGASADSLMRRRRRAPTGWRVRSPQTP